MTLHPSWLWESAGAFYAAVSGWIPDITLIGAAASLYRAHNCHTRGCWRFAHHELEVNGQTHKVCRKCHGRGGGVRLERHHLDAKAAS